MRVHDGRLRRDTGIRSRAFAGHVSRYSSNQRTVSVTRVAPWRVRRVLRTGGDKPPAAAPRNEDRTMYAGTLRSDGRLRIFFLSVYRCEDKFARLNTYTEWTDERDFNRTNPCRNSVGRYTQPSSRRSHLHNTRRPVKLHE